MRGTVSREQDFIFDANNKLIEDGVPIPKITKRAVACVTARITSTDRDTKVCATHLETGYPTENQDAAAQVRELARVFGPEARQMPFILAGDTNIPTPPTDAAIGPLYGAPLGTGDFWEIEQERACETSPTCDLAQGGQVTYEPRNEKLDYVFASRWHMYIPVGRVSSTRTSAIAARSRTRCRAPTTSSNTARSYYRRPEQGFRYGARALLTVPAGPLSAATQMHPGHRVGRHEWPAPGPEVVDQGIRAPAVSLTARSRAGRSAPRRPAGGPAFRRSVRAW